MKLLITAIGLANLASKADGVALLRASAIMPASARDFTDFTARLPVSVEGPAIRKPPEIVQSAAAVLLYGVTIGLALATTVLMLCGMYDLAGNWRHRARFHSCHKKVLRVHEAFQGGKQGDMQLCPFCVEPVSGFLQPSEVVFLCGHRFHMKCANKWFRECPQQAGMCPMCEGPEARDGARDVSEGSSLDCNDESKSLILYSLHRRYPDIVSNVCVERWSACHTEIWLSELKCPKYQSIFTNQRK